jgi:hypothetical protein
MNRLPKLILWFFMLLFIQAFVFDPILLGIPYVPFVYVLLLIFVPNDWASWIVLLVGFFIGLCVDFIFVTGGVHAAASLVISYARPLIIRAAFSDTTTLQNVKIEQEPFGVLLRYVSLFILIHHFFVFVFIVGTTEHIGWLLNAWFTNSLLTILAIIFILILTRNVKR